MSGIDIVARAIALRARMQSAHTFMEFESADLPATGRIESVGHSRPGQGAATYIADELASAALYAAHRNAVFKAQGRFLRLLGNDGWITPEQVGCPPYRPGVNQQPYIQAAMDYAQAVGLSGVVLTQAIYELWCPARTGDLSAEDNHTGSFLLIQGPLSLKSSHAGRTTLHCKGPHGGSLAIDYQILSGADQGDGVIWRGPGIKITGGQGDRQLSPSNLVRSSILLKDIVLHSDASWGGSRADSATVQQGDRRDLSNKGITRDHDGADAILRLENVDVSGFLGDCISLSRSGANTGATEFVGRNLVLKHSNGYAIALEGVDIVDIDGLTAEKCGLSIYGSIGRDHGHLRNARFRDCGPGTIYGGGTVDLQGAMFQPFGNIHLRLENCGDLHIGANIKAEIDAVDTRILAVATGPDMPIQNIDAHVVSTAHRAVLDGSLHLAGHPESPVRNVENCSFTLDVRRTDHALLNGFYHKSMIVFGGASYGAHNEIRVRGNGGGELITISKPLMGMRVKVVDDGVDTSLATAPARFDATAGVTPEFQYVWLRAEFGGSAERFVLTTPSTIDFADGHEAVIEHRDANSPKARLLIDDKFELALGGRVKLRARKSAGQWDVIEQVTAELPAAPLAPGPITNLAVANLTSTSVTLTFTDAERANSHDYRINDGTWSPLAPDKTIVGLLPLTNYGVQVRGIDGDLQGEASAAITFATLAEKDVTAPQITSGNPSGTYAEGKIIGGTLTANEAVTWAVSGPDADKVTLDASTGMWSLETTDYEARTGYAWTFVASDAAGNSTSQAVSLTITNINEALALRALDLSNRSVREDGPATIAITGATTGSTITLASGSLPAGMTLNSAARTITGTPSAAGTRNFTLRETLADSPNSGRETPLSLSVTGAGDTTAPTITSPATASIAEGSPITITLTASEPVTWAKTGGADAAAFTLSGSALTLPARDWEAPTDADANNTYVVQVTATDATGNATSQTITVTVTDVTEGLFLQDTFDAPVNTNITALTPVIGSAWLLHPSSNPSAPLRVDDGNRLYSPAAGLFYNPVAPGSADYFVEADFFRRGTLSSDRMGIAGRCSATEVSMYLLRWNETLGQFTLNTLVGTTLTQLGNYSTKIATGTARRARLTMQGDQISVQVDGQTVIGPVTDRTITAPGYAAIRSSDVQGVTTGIHLDNFIAGTLAVGTPQPAPALKPAPTPAPAPAPAPTPATIYGAGVQRMSYEPAPVTQPATLAALITELGVTSADVVDFATGNAGGPFASIKAWLTACYGDGSNPKIGALPSGTYSHASAMQRAPRAIYGYGTTMPEIVESLTHSTTTAINWGAGDNRVVLTRDIDDFECRHIKWTGFHTVLGSGRYSQPLKRPSDSVLVTAPYAPSSTYKHTRLVDPRIHGTMMQARRVGRVKFGGGAGTVSALTALRVKPDGFSHDSNASNTNYFNDTVWAANTETVSVAAGAGDTVDPAAAASALIERINADSATTYTRAVAGRAVGEVYIIRDTLVPVSTAGSQTGPEDYLHLYCTTTGTLTVETDTSLPSARFVDCRFTNVDTVVVSCADVAAPGLNEFYRCEGIGTWGFVENQHTRWDGSGVRASNNIWRDCIGTRQQPNSGVQGTGTMFYFAAEKTGFNRLHSLYPTICRIDRNTATDIESVAVASSANASSAVFVDIRYPSPLSTGTLTYNKVHRVKNLEGHEDANAVYGKLLGGGMEVAYNWFKDCGAAYVSDGQKDGSECTVILFKEGAHKPNDLYELNIHHNLIEDMPDGIPMVKVDQQLCRVRVWQNHFRNWRNILGGAVNTDATHAGVIRFTERAKQIEVYSNLFENIDMAGSFLLVNFHNLKTTATSGLVSFPDTDFSKWIIASNTRQNDGSADYPALTGDQTEFRFSGSLPTGALSQIKTGYNRRLDPSGMQVGVSQIMRDSTTSTTYPGIETEAARPFARLAP